MGQLIKCESASDFIQLCDYFAQTALRAQFLKFNNLDQAKQLAMTAITRGVDMLEVCLAFDIIGGRLCKKSAHMLAEFKARGGKYKILSRTAELAAIEYTYEGQTQKFELSWDAIKDEDYTKEKDKVTYKPRYLQPHSRSQMLWARLISDSVGAIAPECKGGYYTPEEIEDVIDGECVTMTAGSLPAPGVIVEPTVNVTVAASMEQSQTEQVATQSTVTTQVDVMISAEQVRELNGLFVTCGVSPENIAKSLAKRNVTRVEDLTAVQASEIIATLRDRAAALTAPITPELDAKIQEAIKLRAQTPGGTTIVEACKIHLESHKTGIHQLTVGDAQRLLAAIEQGDVKLFLNAPLSKPGKA